MSLDADRVEKRATSNADVYAARTQNAERSVMRIMAGIPRDNKTIIRGHEECVIIASNLDTVLDVAQDSSKDLEICGFRSKIGQLVLDEETLDLEISTTP